MPTLAEDRDEILQLLYRYSHSADSGDIEGLAACFTHDGAMEIGGVVFSGREELLALTIPTGLRHRVTNVLIEVNIDVADSRAYVLVTQGGVIRVSGIYDDDLVRTFDGWRIRKRVFITDEI